MDLEFTFYHSSQEGNVLVAPFPVLALSLGNERLYADFQLYTGGPAPPAPMLLKGRLYAMYDPACRKLKKR